VEAPVLTRVASGDANAVKACIACYGGLVWSLARRFSTSTADAEDAVQDIFVDLWKSAARYDPRIASEAAFVTVVARRRLVDRRRRRTRRPDSEPMPEKTDYPSHAPDAELCSEAALASRAIAELRPEQRDVLLMATVEGLTHDEIASSTGMPLGTVKAHVRRGLLRVRELLGRGRNEGIEAS
jgi:RNA polymerase sigma-70 factor (ECF subfamily)